MATLDDIDKKVDDLTVQVAVLTAVICGNGTKGLAARVAECEETEKDETPRVKKQIADCREGEPGRIRDEASKIPPRMSWKQILAVLVIYCTVAGGIGAYNFISFEDMKKNIVRIEDRLHELELKQ